MASTAATEGLLIKIEANLDSFNKAIKAAQERINAFSAATENARKAGLALSVAGAAINAAIIKSVSSFAKAGDEVEKMSQRTGISVKALQELKYAANQSGTSLDAVQVSIKKLQTSITEASDGSEQYVKSFSALGLSIEEIKKLAPEEQFRKVAGAIAEIQNPTERAARAVEFFGRSGTDMLPMLADGAEGLQKLRDRASEVGYVMDADAAHQGVVFLDTIDDIKTSVAEIINIFAQQLIPVLQKVAKFVSNLAIEIKGFAERNKTLISVIGAVALSVGALASILGGALTIITVAVPAVIALSSVLAPMGIPIGAIFFRPYDLRHTAATKMIESGESLTKVSNVLRHSSTKTTEKVYVHIPRRLLKDTVKAIDYSN
jgi:DNA-binding transcriptional MerR regulator